MRRKDWVRLILANYKNLLRIVMEARVEYRKTAALASAPVDRSVGPLVSSEIEKLAGLSKRKTTGS
jgi:hypothetical protein